MNTAQTIQRIYDITLYGSLCGAALFLALEYFNVVDYIVAAL